MLLVSAKEMKELDNKVQAMGVPALILMENAGKALAHHSDLLFKKRHLKEKTAVVLAGPGQNGGDGFCAARHLSSMGYKVHVALFGDFNNLPNEARHNYEMLRHYPVNIHHVNSAGFEETFVKLESPSLIIDALLGTGAKGPPRYPMDLAVKWANLQQALKVACDIPTGLSADTGYADGECIRADLTVTLGFAKIGLLSYPGRKHAGEIIVEGLGFPNSLAVFAGAESEFCQGPTVIKARTMDYREAQHLLPTRRADQHKGMSGHVTVIAGSLGMAGAAVLSAKGALKAGAGTVTLVCPNSVYQVCAWMVPEVMVVPCGGSSCFTPFPESVKCAASYIEKSSALVIGPGWGRGRFQTDFLKEILPLASKITCIVDADALYALKELGGLPYLDNMGERFVLTPHTGELARLIDCSAEDIEKDRPGNARKASYESKSIMCLKGAGTCVADPFGLLFINTSGAPCMATAGSGDILTGVIAALAAQGLSPAESARLGVFWHGLAGEIAQDCIGSVGVLAGDILESLPEARRSIILNDKGFTGLGKEVNGRRAAATK